MPASGEMEALDTSPLSKKCDKSKKCENGETGSCVIEIDLASRSLANLPSELTATVSTHITTLLVDHNDLESLPDDFGRLFPNLEVLSLTGNLLKCLPDSIGCLECLRELYINENEISLLCNSLCKLKFLEIFKATGNKIKAFPTDIGDIKNLRLLYLDENMLQSLPESLGMLRRLEILDCGDNQLESVPVSIGQLERLKILNLCNNKVEYIPETLGDLAHLEIVDLSGNFIESLPSYFCSVDSLKKLYADRNKLATIPEWMSELKGVAEISLKDNKFQHQALSEKFGHTCKQLKTLDLAGNFMTKLPDSIGMLVSLEKFCLGSVIDELERRAFQNGNWLSVLPDSICDIVNLRELHLDENLFQELPKDFGNLINLQFLDLGQNLLHELPESFGNLKSLKICQLSKNKLEILPSSFGNLSALEDLRLDNNALAELPESFCNLTNLKTLDLFNNRLTEVPAALNFFTKLIRMDLQENHFSIPWHEIPQIMTSSKYPDRDPKLKNNWRGRPRQDLAPNGIIIHKLQDTGEVSSEEEEEEDDDEVKYRGYSNRDELFRQAAIRNLSSSIWQTHTGPTKREKFVRHEQNYSYRRYSCEQESEPDDNDNRESDNTDDDYEPPIFTPKIRNTDKEDKNEITEKSEDTNEAVEDWDAEIEEIQTNDEDPYGTFNSLYCHAAPRTLAEAGYVVDEHLFLPYDIHNQPVIKPNIIYRVEDGQFDDDDDDDDDNDLESTKN